MKTVLARCTAFAWALGLSGASCRGEDLFVAVNLDRDERCEFAPDPRAYADQLDAFDGTDLLVHIELRATTAGGDAVGSNPFQFGVAICDGCRTFCASEPAAAALGDCSGHALGVDREFCIDDEC
jgi:hypothetical protein